MNIRRLVSCVLILCVTLCGCMSKKVDSTEKKNGGYTQTTEKQESKKETPCKANAIFRHITTYKIWRTHHTVRIIGLNRNTAM